MKLISGHGLDDVLAWRPTGPVRVREFLADAHALATALPAGGDVLNLCEDRYHFAVLFAACLLTGKVSLQPSSHSAETLQRLAVDHPGCFAVIDSTLDVAGLPSVTFPDLSTLNRAPVDGVPEIDEQRVVAILFTSGSTGMPQAQAKTWGRLVQNGRAEAAGLGLDRQPHVLVGTVPVQHSYGFESTFLLALHGGCSFWSGKPFYPQDVVDALAAVPRPRMLVTTPYHLSALLGSGLDWPALDICLSATAPLGAELAARVEQHGGAPVHEIYGSTESGQLACRRTTDGPAWQVLPGVVLSQENDTTYASKGHVEGRVPLSDIIELQGGGRFLLHGRHADLVNIAGKRSSLAYLNHQLCAIDGVRDGAFFLPDGADDDSDGITRLTAFVVAPGVASKALLSALRQRIDRVFMPRPLVFVDALPRNSTGKLVRATLQDLYRQHVSGGGAHGGA
ncbi:AMP-binding protein [Hydrogenophaga sp. RWCD_12]|uniref:AMP-binding protein n=1 Tax=Hydrogenophaga sp. RWCD_12 TaxID=3391190 RepID=UPI003984AC72